MNKLISLIDRLIEAVMVLLITAMVLGNFWQIYTRFILNNAASWTEEFLRYALIWLTMLGVPYAYGKNQHVAIEFIANTFGERGKVADQILIEVIVLLISIFVMVIGGSMVTANAVGQTSPALGVPMQYYYAGVPLCGVLTAIYTLPRLIEQIGLLKNGNKEGK